MGQAQSRPPPKPSLSPGAVAAIAIAVIVVVVVLAVAVMLYVRSLRRKLAACEKREFDLRVDLAHAMRENEDRLQQRLRRKKIRYAKTRDWQFGGEGELKKAVVPAYNPDWQRPAHFSDDDMYEYKHDKQRGGGGGKGGGKGGFAAWVEERS